LCATLTAIVLMPFFSASAKTIGPGQSSAAADLKGWRTDMAQGALPSRGCFTATFPGRAWRQVPCAATPRYPQLPRRGLSPQNAGNGIDASAEAPTGNISTAIGSFDKVSVTSESGPINNTGPAIANAYTLQLNTNTFPTPLCAGSPNPGCLGWQQFIYENTGTLGRAYIQRWLIGYNTTCPVLPVPWNSYIPPNSTNIDCWMNSTIGAVPLPGQPVTNLRQLELAGSVGPGGDSVIMFVAANAYLMAAGDDAIDASAGWKIAEFNVVGDGSAGQATFSKGAQILLRTRIIYGGTAAPICVNQGFTGETNNLNFGTPQPAVSAPGPAIRFLENSAGGAKTPCAAAATVKSIRFGKTKTPIASIGDDSEGIHLFAVGPDGHVWTDFFNGVLWSGWIPVPGATPFTLGTPIALVPGASNTIHLFAVGQDSHVQTDYFNGTTWSGWTELPGTFAQLTPITLLRGASNTIHLFAVGQNGHVKTNFFNGTTWAGWTELPGTFTQLTPITLVPGASETIHLFAVDQIGTVRTNFFNGTSWGSVWKKMPGATFAQDTPIALLPGASETIHLFAVDQVGTVQTDFFNGTSWSGWIPVPGATTFTPGAPIALVPGASETIHLFAVGQDSHLQTDFFNGSTWSGWIQVPDATPFPQGTPIASLPGASETIHLFAVAQGGTVRTDFFDGTTWIGSIVP
jgi:hypothetical protein